MSDNVFLEWYLTIGDQSLFYLINLYRYSQIDAHNVHIYV